MNTKKVILKNTLGVMFATVLLFSACGKKAEIETSANNEEATAQNKEEGDAIGNETQNIADAYAADKSSSVVRNAYNEIAEASGCATVTHDTVAQNIVIDFGTTNCLCNDGRNRRGKILVSYTGGKYKDVGSVKTITFDNFYRNDNKIEGTRVVTNKGKNDLNNYHWEVKETNMKVTKTDGKTHTWNSARDREILAGYDTKLFSDDEYRLTGTSAGVNQNGINYTATIITPLHRLLSCRWIDKGVIEFENEKGAKRTLDFGDGACDNIAMVTVTTTKGKTKTKEITLR